MDRGEMNSDYVPHEKVAIDPFHCIRESRSVIGEQYWLFVGVTTVGWLIASAVPFNILLGPMVCGMFLCFQQRMRGEQAKFETLECRVERLEDDGFAAPVDFGNHLRREAAATGLVFDLLWTGARNHLTSFSGSVDRKVSEFGKFGSREFHKEFRTSLASRLL